MSNDISYKWQRFFDGIHEIKQNDDVLLLEMKQSIIDRLKNEIQQAESGRDQNSPFNDIFGESSPDNIKNRMLIPYGNEDLNKMKILMLDIFDKLFKEYNSNSNVQWVKAIVWDNKKEVVKQQRKPQGWEQGDPIPTIDKEVGSPVVDVTYISKLGDKKERTVQFSFGKLLQKYFPQEMTWWQGDKTKNISGKQTFFTSNPETMDLIVHEIKYGDEQTIRNPQTKNSVVIFTRHPIDVVRMSDFRLLDYSCHAQGGAYFNCAIQEARRSATGGGVLFLVSKEKFDKAFPDGIIPQTGDIFNDSQRGITDKLNAEPTARLRVRRIVDANTDIEYAVPDKKIYGNSTDAFAKETLDYFASSQKQKFIDPETNEPFIPKRLIRYGGEYEDGGEYKVGNTFARLMNKAFQQAEILDKVKQDEGYVDLLNSLDHYSIAWVGDEEAGDEEDNTFCEEFEEEVERNIARISRQLNYMRISHQGVVCEDPVERMAYVQGFAAFVTITIPKNKFTSLSRRDIEETLNNYDYQNEDSINNTSITWPDMKLNGYVSVEFPGEDVEIEYTYTADETAFDPEQIMRYGRDFIQFEGQVSLEDYTNEIEAILEKAGLIKPVSNVIQQQISDLVDSIDEDETVFQHVREGRNHKFSTSARPIIYKEISDMKNPSAQESYYNTYSSIFKNKFYDIFFNRADLIDDELKKQIPLFHDIPPRQINRLKLPRSAVLVIPYASINNLGTYGKDEAKMRQQFQYSYDFIVTIDSSLTDEEIMLSLAFVKYMNENIEILDDIALEAFNSTFAKSLKEKKKATSSNLIKEGKWKIKILV
jgi:hypothetical protein